MTPEEFKERLAEIEAEFATGRLTADEREDALKIAQDEFDNAPGADDQDSDDEEDGDDDEDEDDDEGDDASS